MKNNIDNNLIESITYIKNNYYNSDKHKSFEYFNKAINDYIKECKKNNLPINYQILHSIEMGYSFSDMFEYFNDYNLFNSKLEPKYQFLLSSIQDNDLMKSYLSKMWVEKEDGFFIYLNKDLQMSISYLNEYVFINLTSDYLQDEGYYERYCEKNETLDYYKSIAYELFNQALSDISLMQNNGDKFTYEIGGLGGDLIPFFNWRKFDEIYLNKLIVQKLEAEGISFSFDDITISMGLSKTWYPELKDEFWLTLNDYIKAEVQVKDIDKFLEKHIGFSNDYIRTYFMLNSNTIIKNLIDTFLFQIVECNVKEFKFIDIL